MTLLVLKSIDQLCSMRLFGFFPFPDDYIKLYVFDRILNVIFYLSQSITPEGTCQFVLY